MFVAIAISSARLRARRRAGNAKASSLSYSAQASTTGLYTASKLSFPAKKRRLTTLAALRDSLANALQSSLRGR